MSYIASRLTMFAIVTSIENDLRSLIIKHLEHAASVEELLGSDLAEKAKERLEKDVDIPPTNPSLGSLLFYVDLGDYLGMLQKYWRSIDLQSAAHLRQNRELLNAVIPIRNRIMHARPLNHDDFPKMFDLAKSLVAQRADLWGHLSRTLDHLKEDPSYVLNLEIPYCEIKGTSCVHNLPIGDFDETGFIGREEDTKRISSLCRGPYPVISILGAGGLGKTALAIKVAYDLLDDPNNPYEAIVWTTTKTAQLTPLEIRKIEGAICSSLGMLSNITEYLAGSGTKDPIEDLLEYLRMFPILLILDNLETILDDRIKTFLERLPSGSKVLITSRIGLGAFDVPVSLQPMSNTESITLLRSFAMARGVNDLVSMSNKQLEHFCDRMKHNPGFIKWFVTAVQVGRRPEEVLAEPSLFYDFCMSNVYKYLSDKSKQVLRSMHSSTRQLGTAELAYLNDMEAIEIQRALQQLLATNMAVMRAKPMGKTYETTYELGEFARAYINKNYPLTEEEMSKWSKKRKSLVVTAEEAKAEIDKNPLSVYCIVLRTPSDAICAKELMIALRQSKVKEFADAELALKKAKDLAPDYYEVYRVEAWVKVRQGDYNAARECYNTALELNPQYGPLRYWYAGFLLRHQDDVEAAMQEFVKADKLMPNVPEIKLEMARTKMFLHKYDDAQKDMEDVIQTPGISSLCLKKAYDSHLQVFDRRAQECITQRDYIGCIRSLEICRQAYERIPLWMRDSKIKEKAIDVRDTANVCMQRCSEAITRARSQTIVDWANKEATQPEHCMIEQRMGKIVEVLSAKNYAFIEVNGTRFCFYKKNLRYAFQWDHVAVGNTATFTIRVGKNGPTARNVFVVDSGVARRRQRWVGHVARICENRFGFIALDTGGEIYFNKGGLRNMAQWNLATPNTNLTFRLRETPAGFSAFDIAFDTK